MTNKQLTTNTQKALQALKNRVAKTGAGAASMQYIKFTKTGEWEYNGTEVSEDSEWAVNPLSVKTGFISWVDGKVAGEFMASGDEPEIIFSDLPATDGDWDAQAAISFKCIEGADKGAEVEFKTSSKGGKDFVADILAEVEERIEGGENTFVPVIRLETDSYKHTKYGKIYTPDFDILEWVDMDGTVTEEPEPKDPEPEEPAPKKRSRRRA